MPLATNSMLLFSLLSQVLAWMGPVVGQARPDAQREKAIIRQQFSKSFHDLQVVSQQMLQEHGAGQLTTTQLSKQAKSINKSAKTLRALMALGELAHEPHPVEKSLSDAN